MHDMAHSDPYSGCRFRDISRSEDNWTEEHPEVVHAEFIAGCLKRLRELEGKQCD